MSTNRREDRFIGKHHKPIVETRMKIMLLMLGDRKERNADKILKRSDSNYTTCSVMMQPFLNRMKQLCLRTHSMHVRVGCWLLAVGC